MKPVLIRNIKEVVAVLDESVTFICGKEMDRLNTIKDGFIFIEDGIISRLGKMEEISGISSGIPSSDIDIIDASEKYVFPSFCDSHTHLVYAGSREQEFSDRIRGLSYEEIAAKGGGILNSARRLHETSEEELFEKSADRISEIISLGTGAVEIKSGYGLNTDDELKMLRIIRRLKEETPLEIRSTFLGAHAVPEEFRGDRNRYVELILNEMIPAVASEDLADYIDVFCDRGFFSPEETESILMAGIKHGLLPKLHANEFGRTGGVQVGVKYDALSVDHLECIGDEEIEVLTNSRTMPTLLPGSVMFLGLTKPPARKMIDSGLPVALASDFNPGSSPSGNMKLVMSLACINLKMTPEETINAATINSAYAMGISETHGSISKGKVANLFITKEMPSYNYFPYAYGSNLIEKVILKGKIIK